MDSNGSPISYTLPRDLTAGLVTFLVALPLCLGVSLASGAPLISGVLAGVVGGVLVGCISQSHTSVSGPAAGLAAVVATQISALGFPTFLMAVVIAGLLQSTLGFARGGGIAAFIPTSVIKGLLAAIGVLLILKQFPHLLGHDVIPSGDMAFQQQGKANTLSEFLAMWSHLHLGAAVIGVLSVILLLVWRKCKLLQRCMLPAPLIVVLLGMGLAKIFSFIGDEWVIGPASYVRVPVADSLLGLTELLQWPDFTQWSNPAVYRASIVIAAVASLETLLNLEAVDKIDPKQRTSPPNLELLAQGIGNVVTGLVGGIPITSVIVRSSVNIDAGGQTKLATIVHGGLLLASVAFLPQWLNRIPLSCLAAILLVTGIKLASPKLFRQLWQEGRYQFAPFIVTVIAIVLTDLLIGVLIGLAVSIGFILNSNLRRPVRRFVERHLGGDVLHVELANQVSFLNRASLIRVLDEVPCGSHVLLDAVNTDYIDPDIQDVIQDFTTQAAPARGVEVSLLGFRSNYQLCDQIQYVDYSTRELQGALTPKKVLEILCEGNKRFRSGQRLTRDLGRQVQATANGQHPLAVVLSCIDSRTPAELIFDVGIGDILSVRIAGNISSREVVGSIEYACSVAGAKLVIVMGHTRCGAVTTAVNLYRTRKTALAMQCPHLQQVVDAISPSIDESCFCHTDYSSLQPRDAVVDRIAVRNVGRTVGEIVAQSETIASLVCSHKLIVVGALYDIGSGEVRILDAFSLAKPPRDEAIAA